MKMMSPHASGGPACRITIPLNCQFPNIASSGRDHRFRDASGRANEGLLTYEDLGGFHAAVEEPVTVDYRGLDVYKCGPWCQGPVFLQQLTLLEGFDLGKMGHNSADTIHTWIEGAKLVKME